jgi:asparagine synthase (glutamine-hydrolysing)
VCGLAGAYVFSDAASLEHATLQRVFDQFLEHRGPDARGSWSDDSGEVYLSHHRLAIIDTTSLATQPMKCSSGNVVSFNGEIYNFRELRQVESQRGYRFRSNSDTEVILACFDRYGTGAFSKFRGMFSIALWDSSNKQVLLCRDRFGIKPLYYCEVGGVVYFASEIKALLPFVKSISTNNAALSEYLTFQYTISGQTMFNEIKEIPPGHYLTAKKGSIALTKYWDVTFNVDHGKPVNYFHSRLDELLRESVSLHLRSDVEVGSYVSGGLDSSLIHVLAARDQEPGLKAFHGRFPDFPGFDESAYARDVTGASGGDLIVTDISAQDFIENIEKVIYYLDQPVAGPGSFPQLMVSQTASQYVKVVLGGQGGDEVFGGYARYLIAYFEQCIKAAIDGTYRNGNYVVTIESIIPNLGVLQEYKPLIQEFWRDGLFGPLDRRFLRLIDRSTDMKEEIDWTQLDMQAVYERFYEIFNNRSNVRKEAYFDSMTHFEFKTLLPALLHVEDRMSMAHGLESRVPFLDHHLVEFAATIPADVKFKDGRLKHLLRSTFRNDVPDSVLNRRDKMGFPVPLKEWFEGELKDFFFDTIASMESKSRPGLNPAAIRKNFQSSGKFSRKTWALLSLELWHQQFHDRAAEYRAMARK